MSENPRHPLWGVSHQEEARRMSRERVRSGVICAGYKRQLIRPVRLVMRASISSVAAAYSVEGADDRHVAQTRHRL